MSRFVVNNSNNSNNVINHLIYKDTRLIILIIIEKSIIFVTPSKFFHPYAKSIIAQRKVKKLSSLA